MNLKECKIDIDNIMLDIQMILERITTIEDYIKKGQKIESTPIDPGDGHRLLEDDEIIQAGDECSEMFNTNVPRIWICCSDSVGFSVSSFGSRVYVRRKIDTHKYIEPAEGIVPWQYYILNHDIDGDIVIRILYRFDSTFWHIQDAKTGKIWQGTFAFSELSNRYKIRLAAIDEIPEHCLIGKVVVAWDNDKTEAEQGIIIDAPESESKYKYCVVMREDHDCDWYKNIELIDHPANY